MEEELSHKIIGASIEVHKTFGGPGMFESVYEAALFHELSLKGLQVQRQRAIEAKYKGIVIKEAFIIDLLVGGKVIVEVKATEKNHPIFETQLLTYLRITGLKLGLLVNFGYAQVKDGISRVINGFL